MAVELGAWRVTHADLEAFKAALEGMFAAHHKAHYPMLKVPTVKIEVGTKFARIWRDTGAYAFIDMATGNILKPDGWKRPAKGARGNIFADDPLAGCGPYGVAYLR